MIRKWLTKKLLPKLYNTKNPQMGKRKTREKREFQKLFPIQIYTKKKFYSTKEIRFRE